MRWAWGSSMGFSWHMGGECGWGAMDGWRDGGMGLAGVFGRTPPAHLTHIVAELSFPLGNHLTPIKRGGRGDSGEKKDGSVSTLGKSSLERLKDSRGNSSAC